MRGDASGFPITFDVDGAEILLVGVDEDAARKRELLQEGGAHVRQIMAHEFSDAALDGKRLVFVTRRDPALAERVFLAARARGVPAWCSDDPAHSDFAMPAVARLGPLRIAISTAGGSPALAAKLRALFEHHLGQRLANFTRALTGRRKESDIAGRRADLDGFDLEIHARYPDWFKEQE
jgi:uroporphyrin-III C-methyltransferase/precorrin-2 dehydrogenase/sirohydrochlorin ferrochelatase